MFELPSWLPLQDALPALVGSVCALGLLVIFTLIRMFRPRPKPQKQDPLEIVPSADKNHEFDPFVSGSASEKREVFRRKGNPVKVLVRGEGFWDDPIGALVVDRSSGGMALLVPIEVTSGALVQVRPERAPETTQWAEVEIRSARPEQGEWLLGCKFVESIPWSLMLQFG